MSAPVKLLVSEIAADSPEMDEAAFSEFVEDIRRNGQLVPIWKSANAVIDGRKRLRACQILGIEPKVVDMSGGQDPEAINYALNVLRTHYTPSQRAMFAARRSNWPSGKTKAKGSEFGPLDKTAAEAAKEAGVHRQRVFDAKRVLRDGAPEVATAVETGRLTLHSAERIMKSASKHEQAAAVERIVAESRGKKRAEPVSRNGRRDRPIRRGVSLTRAIATIQGACDALSGMDLSVMDHAERRGAIPALTAVIRRLVQLRKRLR